MINLNDVGVDCASGIKSSNFGLAFPVFDGILFSTLNAI